MNIDEIRGRYTERSRVELVSMDDAGVLLEDMGSYERRRPWNIHRGPGGRIQGIRRIL